MFKALLVFLTKDFIKNIIMFIVFFGGLTFVLFLTLIMWVDASQIEEQGRLDANEKYFEVMKR
ncbi:hypothetical protein [Acinetobacter sp. CFCC 10889]|uniref:hypothetical protein n=1 Tax=Acinetobacter sp. CFCC 10889 TaxID=1775557 RepID=UPI000DD0D847|nr:hypothetical protein [Acinetobacter sp. CFCC 10889]